MNIRDFMLAWRRTDPEYSVLPEEVLRKLEPLEPREAQNLDSRSHTFLDNKGNLSADLFSNISKQSADVSSEVGRDWLRAQQPELSIPVVVVWGQHAALRTTWKIFTAHWDDFCDPASDDVLVWPEAETWALVYDHEEHFEFGRRAAG